MNAGLTQFTNDCLSTKCSIVHIFVIRAFDNIRPILLQCWPSVPPGLFFCTVGAQFFPSYKPPHKLFERFRSNNLRVLIFLGAPLPPLWAPPPLQGTRPKADNLFMYLKLSLFLKYQGHPHIRYFLEVKWPFVSSMGGVMRVVSGFTPPTSSPPVQNPNACFPQEHTPNSPLVGGTLLPRSPPLF